MRPITIRHLLTHTAGLGLFDRAAGAAGGAYTDNGLNPAQVSRLEEVPGGLNSPPAPSLEAFADALARMPLVYQPGTHWSYSVGLDLMGRIIEVVSGKSFDAFLQERIFDPCDMSSTWFQVPESQKDRLTANYFLIDGEPLPIDLPDTSVYLDKPAFPFGGAGLVSSPRDYDRFLMMLAGFGEIEGQRVMSEPAVRLATSNLFPDTLAPDGGFTSGDRAFGLRCRRAGGHGRCRWAVRLVRRGGNGGSGQHEDGAAANVHDAIYACGSGHAERLPAGGGSRCGGHDAMTIAFCEHGLNRDDHARANPERLAELRLLPLARLLGDGGG